MAKGSILYTKLQRPPVAPDSVLRDRLIDLLEAGRYRPMTLISAPAGYGKSTLVGHWLDDCDCAYGWVSLDKNENDLRLFLHYLLAALQPIFPTPPMRTTTLLDANRLPSAEALARYLLNDLHQAAGPFILVLDDYHSITDASVHDFMTELLEHPAKAIHLVLLTRKDPPLPIATLRGKGLMTEIRVSDLRFTPDEVTTFMNRMLNIAFDTETAGLIETKTEGWATGLRLAGIYLQGSKDLKRQVQSLSGSIGHIAEYLVAEVLSRRHPEMLPYLLETSIVDRFCAPLCGHIHQTKHMDHEIGADAFIRRLSKNNLFVIALDDEGYWFRYHHLFQGFLKAQLHKQYTGDKIKGLHRTAGNWFAQNDLFEEAIDHLLASGDTAEAIQLIVDKRYALMNASQFFRLRRLLSCFPEDTIAGNAFLISTRAFIGIEQGVDADADAFTAKAEKLLAVLPKQSEEHVILKGEVLVLQSLMDLLRDEAPTGFHRAQTALDYLPENAALIRSLAVGTRAACQQMMGNADQAVSMIGKTLTDRIWPANIEARIHFYQCIVQYMDANLAGAMNAAHRCLRAIEGLPFYHTRTFANYFLGAAHYLQNQPKAAEMHLLKVVDDRYTANPSYVAQAGILLARIYLARGDEAAAEQILDQVSNHCRENLHPTALSIIQAFEAESALRQGDIQRANQICRQVDFNVRPPLWFYYIPQFTPIKCLLEQGTDDSLKAARARLAEWDDRMHRINRKNVRIEISALLSLVYHQQGDESAALQHLQTALDLGKRGGWIRLFVDLGNPMAVLLERFTQVRPAREFTQTLLKACRVEQPWKLPLAPDSKNKGADLLQRLKILFEAVHATSCLPDDAT